jgi:hypothetical protein
LQYLFEYFCYFSVIIFLERHYANMAKHNCGISQMIPAEQGAGGAHFFAPRFANPSPPLRGGVTIA